MNGTSNPNPDAGTQSQGSANQSSHSSSGRGVFESMRCAMNEGAQQAKAAAERTAPKVKAALSEATYFIGFATSFAAVFSYTLATELAPEALKRGLREGGHTGQKAAEEFANNCKPHSHTAGSTSSQAI